MCVCKMYNLIFYCGSYSEKLLLLFFVIFELTRNKPYIFYHIEALTLVNLSLNSDVFIWQ